MSLKRLFLLFVLSLLVTCGKRDSEEEFINYMDGNWRVEQINCYLDDTTPVEYYIIPDELDILFKFKSRSVYYSVGPECGISTNGNYTMGHTTYTSGYATMLNLLGGGSCTIDENEENGAGNSTIDLELNTAYSGDLLWSYDKDAKRLQLSLPTSFKGSTNLNFCHDECKCTAQMVAN